MKAIADLMIEWIEWAWGVSLLLAAERVEDRIERFLFPRVEDEDD